MYTGGEYIYFFNKNINNHFWIYIQPTDLKTDFNGLLTPKPLQQNVQIANIDNIKCVFSHNLISKD